MGTLGEVVGAVRPAEGMTHEDRAARVGATQATLPRVERGVRRGDGGRAALLSRRDLPVENARGRAYCWGVSPGRPRGRSLPDHDRQEGKGEG